MMQDAVIKGETIGEEDVDYLKKLFNPNYLMESECIEIILDRFK